MTTTVTPKKIDELNNSMVAGQDLDGSGNGLGTILHDLSLTGGKGDTGVTGANGAKGDTGTAGAKGDTGTTGATGTTGQTGATGVGVGYSVSRGITAVTGNATVSSGLASVASVIASSASDLDGANVAGVSASISGTDIILKAWKFSGANDTSLIEATSAVNIAWVAVGTS